jgi:hypothetical protein
MASKGKGKLKEKVTQPPSYDTFIEFHLSQTLQTTDNVKKERKVITHLFFPPFLLLEFEALDRDHSNFLHPTQV